MHVCNFVKRHILVTFSSPICQFTFCPSHGMSQECICSNISAIVYFNVVDGDCVIYFIYRPLSNDNFIYPKIASRLYIFKR